VRLGIILLIVMSLSIVGLTSAIVEVRNAESGEILSNYTVNIDNPRMLAVAIMNKTTGQLITAVIRIGDAIVVDLNVDRSNCLEIIMVKKNSTVVISTDLKQCK